eukprot:1737253-Karenia_brevis.AAC.1
MVDDDDDDDNDAMRIIMNDEKDNEYGDGDDGDSDNGRGDHDDGDHDVVRIMRTVVGITMTMMLTMKVTGVDDDGSSS